MTNAIDFRSVFKVSLFGSFAMFVTLLAWTVN